jgi:glycerophosphoryl diester phosphodiesterase
MHRPVLLIHHAANRGCLHPPNSIRGLRTCLDAGARVVEVDISPLADGDFALLHGRFLEESTTALGPVAAHTSAEVRDLRLVWHGVATDEPVGLLSEAVELVRSYPHSVEVQLDLKPHAPLTDHVLSRLITILQPISNRVRVTSVADWALRRLRAIAPGLPLGFDPLLYLDVNSERERNPHVPPFRRGAYGYWDDHPLAGERWGEPAAYLAVRAEALWQQPPTGAIWYIAARLLAQTLDDGFNWLSDLHSRGAQVAVWTLDADQPRQVALAQRLVALGVDRITTNDPPALARALNVGAIY